MAVKCEICGLLEPEEMILRHMEIFHGVNEEIETWPDGSPVIIDLTIQPEDFSA